MSSCGARERIRGIRAGAGALAPLLILLVIMLFAGCGDDGGGGFKPSAQFLPTTSPENVLSNLALCYNEQDYEELEALVDVDFTFQFTQRDIDSDPDLFPPEGTWGRSEELHAAASIFARCEAPKDSAMAIGEISMVLLPVGALVPCNLVGSPPGTIEGLAYLRLLIKRAEPQGTLSVLSRPHFYFTPDDPDSARTWRLWRIQDARWNLVALQSENSPSNELGRLEEPSSLQSGDLEAYGDDTTVPTRRVTWGWLKAVYRAHAKKMEG